MPKNEEVKRNAVDDPNEQDKIIHSPDPSKENKSQ